MLTKCNHNIHQTQYKEDPKTPTQTKEIIIDKTESGYTGITRSTLIAVSTSPRLGQPQAVEHKHNARIGTEALDTQGVFAVETSRRKPSYIVVKRTVCLCYC